MPGILSFVQEILAAHLAKVPVRQPPKDAPVYEHALARAKLDSKALKMAVYGFFVSAPMGHILVGTLQKAFAGKTGTGAKVAQILASNLLIAPIQCSGLLSLCYLVVIERRSSPLASVYLTSMAIINGAKSVDDVIRTVKGGFMAVMRVRYTHMRCFDSCALTPFR